MAVAQLDPGARYEILELRSCWRSASQNEPPVRSFDQDFEELSLANLDEMHGEVIQDLVREDDSGCRRHLVDRIGPTDSLIATQLGSLSIFDRRGALDQHVL